MGEQEFIRLSAFNWWTLVVIGGALVGIVSFLATMMIRWFRLDMQKMDKHITDSMAEERHSRESCDLQLANALKETANCLNSFKLDITKETSKFVSREEFGKFDGKVDKFHARLDDIYNQLNTNFVSKRECEGKHRGD